MIVGAKGEAERSFTAGRHGQMVRRRRRRPAPPEILFGRSLSVRQVRGPQADSKQSECKKNGLKQVAGMPDCLRPYLFHSCGRLLVYSAFRQRGGFRFVGFAVRHDGGGLNFGMLYSLAQGTYRKPGCRSRDPDYVRKKFFELCQRPPFQRCLQLRPQTCRTYNVYLQPGQYRVVMSNRHTLLTPKSVVLTPYEFFIGKIVSGHPQPK